MDVRCERCKTEYELDDARVTETGVPVKCTTCGYIFRVKKKALIVTVPMRPGEGEGATTLPPAISASEKAEKAREWRIRQAGGAIALLKELTTLQRWIVERKVGRQDEISLTGESWKRIGDIPELLPFFQVVEEAQLGQQLLRSQSAATPSASTAPPAVAPILPSLLEPNAFAPTPSSPPPPPRVTPVAQEGWGSMAAPPAGAGGSGREAPIQLRTPSGERPAVPAFTEYPNDFPALEGEDAPSLELEERPSVRRPSRESMPVVTANRRRPSQETMAARGRRQEAFDEPVPNFGRRGRAGWVFFTLLVMGGAGGVLYYYQPWRDFSNAAASDAGRKNDARLGALIDLADDVDASVTEEAGAHTAEATAPDASVTAAAVPDAGGGAVVVADAGIAPRVPHPRPVRTFDGYMAFGDRLRERDRAEAAMDAYGQAIELGPDRAEGYAGRGLALLDMGRRPQAEASFLQALKLNPGYTVALMGLAETYRMMGRKEDAIRYYERYLELAPSGTEASAAHAAIQKLRE